MEKKIKIIDIQKKLIDLASVDLDDLQTALNILLSEDDTLNKQSIYGFKDLSEKLKVFPLIYNKLENIISIDLRNIFKDLSINPIVDVFGIYAFSDLNENIYKTKLPNNYISVMSNITINMQKSTTIKNSSLDNGNLFPIQIAKEENVSISHVLISEKYELFSLFSNIEFNNYLGCNVYMTNGQYDLKLLNLISNIYPKFNMQKQSIINAQQFNTPYNKSVFKKYIGKNATISINRYKYVYNKCMDIINFIINSYIRYSIPFFEKLSNKKSILNFSVTKPIKYKTWLKETERETLSIFLKKILNINHIKIDDKYIIFDGMPIYEIYNQGALNIFYYFLADYSNKKSLVDMFYSNLTSSNNKNAQTNNIKKQYLENQNKIKRHLLLIESKLGIVKLNKIISDKACLSDINLILSKLETHEKDIITNAYTNQMLLLKTIEENKCPHIKIYSNLRKSNNANYSIKLLKELLTYANSKRDTAHWIICKKCNYPLICPHVIDKIQAEVNLKSYDDILLILDIYINKIVTKEKNENLYNYYCSICSEKIAETSEEFNFKNSKMGDINNHIKIKLWSVVSNSIDYIKFNSPINPNHFVNTATDILYNIINKLNSTRKINLSELYKDDAAEEIDPLIYFYCILFTYAYILYKILINKNIDLKEIAKGAPSSKYAETIIKIIFKKYSLLISQLDLKVEFINKKFIEAYKIIKGLILNDDEYTIPLLMEQIPICDAPYRYAKNIIKMTSLKEISERDMFIKILGKSPEELIEKARLYHAKYSIKLIKNIEFTMKMSNTNLYANLYMPIYNFIKNVPIVSKKYTKTAIDKKNTKTTKNTKTAIDKKNTKTTFDKKRITPSKYDENIFYTAYSIFHEYITKIYSQKEYNEYIIKLNKFKQIENKFILNKQFNQAFSVFYFNIKNTQQYNKKTINISSLYDENGNKHNWNIYCYEDEDLTLSQLKEKKNWSDKILDCKCSICGIKRADLHKLDNNKILKSLAINSEIDIFFIFYQSRCPEGDLHIWNDKKCKKCNLHINYFINKNSDAKEYYNIYYKKYKNAITTIFINNASDTVAADTTITADTTVTVAVAADMPIPTVDYAWVIKLSKFAKIDVNIIEAIGCTNFRKYDNIKEGKDIDIQLPFTSIEDERIYAANAEIRYIFTMYLLLLNIEKNKNNELIALLDKINFPKFEYKNIANFLPSISASEYNILFNYAKIKLDSRELFIFIINHLSFYIMTIANYSNTSGNAKYTESLCKAFSMFLITSIIKNQRLLSAPMTFTWKYFQESDDDNIHNLDQVGDIGEDAEPINEENMQFSEQNIDYDMDSDTEADNYKEKDDN